MNILTNNNFKNDQANLDPSKVKKKIDIVRNTIPNGETIKTMQLSLNLFQKIRDAVCLIQKAPKDLAEEEVDALGIALEDFHRILKANLSSLKRSAEEGNLNVFEFAEKGIHLDDLIADWDKLLKTYNLDQYNTELLEIKKMCQEIKAKYKPGNSKKGEPILLKTPEKSLLASLLFPESERALNCLKFLFSALITSASVIPALRLIPVCGRENCLDRCRSPGDENISYPRDHYRVDCNQLESAKEYIDGIKRFPRRPKLDGHTATYIIKDEKIVLQKSGKERATKMEQAAKFCKENQLNHLLVAESTIYKDFLVQSLLPMNRDGLMDDKRTIGEYMENPDAFTSAVIEFTKFNCHFLNDDLQSRQIFNQLGVFSEDRGGLPRFDNAYPFLENGVGKIALPDLDSCEFMEKGDPKQLAVPIWFFPLHYQLIIQEAKKYFLEIDSSDPELLKHRDNALGYYNNIYKKHLDHLNLNGINLSNPHYIPEISKDKLSIIEEKVAEKLSYFLGVDANNEGEKNDKLKLIKQILQETNAINDVRDNLSRLLEKKSKSGLDSIPKLTKFRSFYLIDEEIPRMVNLKFLGQLLQRLGGEVYRWPVRSVFISVVEELVNEKVIVACKEDHARPLNYVIFL